jgi:hypothetical protein
MSIQNTRATTNAEEYTYKKERAACIALGLDASILDNNEFDVYQLGEIRKGLEDNIDVRS